MDCLSVCLLFEFCALEVLLFFEGSSLGGLYLRESRFERKIFPETGFLCRLTTVVSFFMTPTRRE